MTCFFCNAHTVLSLPIVLFHPFPVLAASDAVRPLQVVQVPPYCFVKTLAEIITLPPSQLPLDLVAVDGVAPVMAGSVLDKGYELIIIILFLSQSRSHFFAQYMHQPYILPL